MNKFIIRGMKKLSGEVSISGAKNASLPIMAAAILTKEEVVLNNVPDLMDIHMMAQLLEMLGKKVEFNGNTVHITETDASPYEAPYDIVRKMRASIAVMGPLLARKGKAKISFPGGCNIGPRPIDLHIRGMKALGSDMIIEHGYIWAQAKELVGKKLNLLGNFGPSVLATENVMMAASLAKGLTVIEGAACEPEVVDLANCLTAMGAKIKGAGSSIVEIEGVKELGGAAHTIIPDRIEAGTFIAAAGMTGGEIHIRNVNINHLEYPIECFSKAGVEIEIKSNDHIIARGRSIRPVELETRPYPFFPTDLQAQLMALVSIADGTSIISEKIFPDRFMHAAEMNRMGADIKVDGATAVIKGVKNLSGAAVMASDLRAGAGLVVAAMAAHGVSEVLRIYHIDRGYDKMEEKLKALGADIERAPQ
jgi:UDP-N-acetylglucosamine 1-carboxyvinyltransferase